MLHEVASRPVAQRIFFGGGRMGGRDARGAINRLPGNSAVHANFPQNEGKADDFYPDQ